MNPINNLDRKISSSAEVDLQEILKLLPWLQHEPLIHLLVMLTTGLATVIVTLSVVFNPTLTLGILALILGLLFFAYLLYYRKLELMVYRWYTYITNHSPQ